MGRQSIGEKVLLYLKYREEDKREARRPGSRGGGPGRQIDLMIVRDRGVATKGSKAWKFEKV